MEEWKHPLIFIDKPIVMKKPAVPSALLLGLGLKLFPVNMQCMLNKDLTQFIQVISQVCQIQGNERKFLKVKCSSIKKEPEKIQA